MRARALQAVAGALVVLVVSACAGIPASGPVTKVADDPGLGESTVRYSPAKPTPGASPEQVVSGYLDAMLAYPVSSRTASEFLTPDAADSWSPAARVRVYSAPDVLGPGTSEEGLSNPRSDLASPVAVRLDFVESARLDRQGHFERRGSRSSVSYRLERIDGEWRIANPQVGVLVDQKFYDDYFRPFNLYFFDRPGKRLVADPVHLVVGDQLATSLLTGLSAGPGRDVRDAVRTYVPPRQALRPSVPVTADGIADVEFSDDFGELTSSARDHLSAQVVWTLRQVPGVDAARIVGDTTPLTANGNQVQSISSWGGYGPSLARGHAYGLVGDKVVQIDRGDVAPLSGSWGRDAHGAVSIAVSDAGVAGVLAGRREVRVTRRGGGGAREIAGNDLIAPRWDSGGTLWLVDRDTQGTRVRVVDGRTARSIDVGRLADLDVESLVFSPDDTRYAVSTGTAGGEVYVGVVLRGAKDQLLGLGDPVEVPTSTVRPVSASWSSVTGLGFLADTRVGRQVHHSLIDGSSTTGGASGGGALLPHVGARSLAIGTGTTPDLYVDDERDRVWYLPPDGSWRQVDTGPLTGLTYGR